MPRLTYHSNRVIIETPYAQPFVDALKQAVEHGYRNWNQHNKTWIVYTPFVSEARRLVKTYYHNVEEINLEAYESAERARADRERQEQEQAEQRRQQYRQDYRYGPFGGQDRRERTNQTFTGSATLTDFATLYVAQDAPKEVVEAAYRALSRLYHPDINPGIDPAKMQKLNAANDAIKRVKGW